jgi:hypothetical protein
MLRRDFSATLAAVAKGRRASRRLSPMTMTDCVPQQRAAERFFGLAIRCRVTVALIAINQNNVEMQGGRSCSIEA